jgi:hypothetical protein
LRHLTADRSQSEIRGIAEEIMAEPERRNY